MAKRSTGSVNYTHIIPVKKPLVPSPPFSPPLWYTDRDPVSSLSNASGIVDPNEWGWWLVWGVASANVPNFSSSECWVKNNNNNNNNSSHISYFFSEISLCVLSCVNNNSNVSFVSSYLIW